MRIIDLTLTLRHGMRGVEFETARTIEHHGWNARTLHLYSHAGTHMDAQTHFAAGTESIDQIPLSRCMGPAWVVDFDDLEPKSLITSAHLGDVAEEFQTGHSLILRTGWSRHVDKPQYYRDNFPRLAEDLAHWCVEKKVKILGVESPSVADVNNLEELTSIHRVLLEGHVTIVEGLANLSELRTARVWIAALPLKVEGGDGCPCRVFAIELTQSEHESALDELQAFLGQY
jgi:kynurenine formamidase